MVDSDLERRATLRQIIRQEIMKRNPNMRYSNLFFESLLKEDESKWIEIINKAFIRCKGLTLTTQ